MSDEHFFELLKARLQECRDIQSSGAMPSIKAMARKKVIDALTVEHSDNWQCVATPYDIINEMCDLVKEAEHYIVFFSLEFLEVMIHERGISPDKIMFIGDNIAESQVASHNSMYGVKSIVFSKNEINQCKFGSEFLYMCINKIGDFMKFNKLAVIANFPYQMQTEAQANREGGKQQAKPIYHLFIEGVIDNIKPDYFASINPSRWMVGGMGLDKHRERMMNDTRIKKIVHFAGDKEVFPTVSIKGGVNYFVWEKDYNGECEFVSGNTSTKRFLNTHDIILQDNNAFGILDKITSHSSKYISETAFSRGAFELKTNFSNWSESGIKCYVIGNAIKYVNISNMNDKHNILNKWKVCTSKAGSVTENNLGARQILCSYFIAEPNSVSTDTYMVVNVFDTKQEAENFISYMKTKFFRFMLGLRVLTQDINKEKFAWVPDQKDYSAPWVDAELYKKYNLTRQEVAYIESKIKVI